MSFRRAIGAVMAPRPLGRQGEDLAARRLRRLGYKIVARGHRSGFGELDLVAVDGRTIVFVEVKTRRHTGAGTPAEAVTVDKQRRLTRAATAFLRLHGLMEYRSRFDVVAVVWPKGERRPTDVEHIRDAFRATTRRA